MEEIAKLKEEVEKKHKAFLQANSSYGRETLKNKKLSKEMSSLSEEIEELKKRRRTR